MNQMHPILKELVVLAPRASQLRAEPQGIMVGPVKEQKRTSKLTFCGWEKVCGQGALRECCLFLSQVQGGGPEEGPRSYFRSVRASQSHFIISHCTAAIHGQDKSRQPPRADTEKSQLALSRANFKPGRRPSSNTSSLADKTFVWLPLCIWVPVNPIKTPIPHVGIKFPVQALRLNS